MCCFGRLAAGENYEECIQETCAERGVWFFLGKRVVRIGNLWPAVIERGNLLRAFHQAARGKRHKLEVRRFAADLDDNLERLRSELMDRSFETGRFNVFKVHDPKERTIHAARFPERVFHHALMNLCEPVLER